VPKAAADPQKKWITLTYFGPYIRCISSLLKQADIRVIYKTTNRIANVLSEYGRHNNEYENSGIYSLRCATCQLAYIGQTGCSPKTRYAEHSRYIRSNNPLSAYAQHVLQQRHEYGPIQETMSPVQHASKSKRMDTLEPLHIQKYHHKHQLIPEQNPHEYNPLFQLLYDTEAHLGIT
jgi:hypothetical protein